MAIYEYRCTECGFQREYIQKMSDVPHTMCPECGQQTFSKMLTAAGFKLKGTGWYATDFKDGAQVKDPAKTGVEAKANGETPAAEPKADTKPSTESQSPDPSPSKPDAKPAGA